MNRKRVFFLLLAGTFLLAIVATTLVVVLRYNAASPVSKPAVVQNTHLDMQQYPMKMFNYPDPTNQDGLPESVKVTGDNETVLLSTSVTEGRQIYECQASTTDASGFAWKLLAPFAMLKADDGDNVIHSTDPTWLHTEDGSEIKAAVAQFVKPDGTSVPASVAYDANAIPWLRLAVTEHRGADGLFSKVDFVQRIYTAGGKPILAGCNQDVANRHVIQSVGYQAEYVFWGRK